MIVHQEGNSRGNYHYNAYIYHNVFWDTHFHGSYELVFVFQGVAELTVNGTQHLLTAGELMLLPPYTVHSLKIQNGETWVGVFSEDFIASAAQKFGNVLYSKFRCDPDTEAILKTYLFHEGQPERLLCIGCLYMACSQCAKNAVSLSTEQNLSFIYAVVNYVSEHLAHNLSLKDVADSMNYEYHYFSSLFHQYFGMNFKEFINRFRFEKACALLAAQGSNVTAVAQSCGFGSIRNFNRVFKALCGYTPREYINRLQK
jgi:AraC-like DNA-binding protein